MIQVTITDEYFTLAGHCHREVCAMATALSVALANGIMEVCGDDFQHILKQGLFTFRKNTDLSQDAKLLINVFEKSITDLAVSYPQYIKVDRPSV